MIGSKYVPVEVKDSVVHRFSSLLSTLINEECMDVFHDIPQSFGYNRVRQ